MLKMIADLLIKSGKNGVKGSCQGWFYQPSIPEELKR
ncbi:MAG: cyclic lactone autoinducer peptide [Halanaerobiaceae bacterium]|jgi:cyclic lactone autoinducer peptide|nr:cyclic lactone autoinducer peptide [Halanaerobiaceae bacterium]